MKYRLYDFFRFISEYALYGMLFFLPISISLFEIFAVFAFLGFVGRKIIRPDFKYLKVWPNIFLLIFFIFTSLSLINSGGYFNKSLDNLFRKWLQFLVIYAIVQDGMYDQKIIKRGIYIVLFSALLAVLSGFSQLLWGRDFLLKNVIMTINGSIPALTSTFSHYNSFGGYLVVVLSLACALLVADNCFGLRAIGLLLFSMVLAAAIMLTFSRGSWVAMGVSLVFLSLLNMKNFYRLIPVIIVIIAMFSIPVIRDRLFYIFKLGGDADRLRYWSATISMIRDHPILGLGVGTFMLHFPKYLPGVNISYAHNCYLQVCAETGIFGLAGFLFFVFSILYVSIKRFLVSRDFLLFGLVSGIMGFLVHSFFDNHLYSFRLAALFWLWTGLMLRRSSNAGYSIR